MLKAHRKIPGHLRSRIQPKTSGPPINLTRPRPSTSTKTYGGLSKTDPTWASEGAPWLTKAARLPDAQGIHAGARIKMYMHIHIRISVYMITYVLSFETCGPGVHVTIVLCLALDRGSTGCMGASENKDGPQNSRILLTEDLITQTRTPIYKESPYIPALLALNAAGQASMAAGLNLPQDSCQGFGVQDLLGWHLVLTNRDCLGMKFRAKGFWGRLGAPWGG